MPGKNARPFGGALAGPHMDEPRDARGGSGLQIGELVAGHDGAGQIEVEASGRRVDHARPGLTPAAKGALLRRVGTGKLGVERDSFCRQQVPKASGNRVIVGPAIEAAADAGLVGDQDQGIAGVAEPAKRRGPAGNETDLVGSAM